MIIRCLLYHKSSRCKPTRRYAVFCHQTKRFNGKMFSDLRFSASRARHGKIRFRRILCLRLLYHKSSRCKPTRRYAVFCHQTKRFNGKMFSDLRFSASRARHGKIRFRRILCLRLLYVIILHFLYKINIKSTAVFKSLK